MNILEQLSLHRGVQLLQDKCPKAELLLQRAYTFKMWIGIAQLSSKRVCSDLPPSSVYMGNSFPLIPNQHQIISHFLT